MVDRIARNLEKLGRLFRLPVGGVFLAPASRNWQPQASAAREAVDHPCPLLGTDLSAFLDRQMPPVLVGPVASEHATVSEYELPVVCSFVVQAGEVPTAAASLWHDATRYGVATYLSRASRTGQPLRVIRPTSVRVCGEVKGEALDALDRRGGSRWLARTVEG